MIRELLRTCAVKCPNHCIFFTLTGDCKRPQPFTECDGILAVHIRYVLYGWESVEREFITINTDIFQLVQEPLMLLYTVRCKNSGCITITFSIYKS
jgi:hypothetical protein